MKFSKYLLITLLGLASLATTGQEEEEINPAIRLIARAYPDSIVLRWAPNTPVTWELTNQYGYLLEKYTILKDGNLVKNPVRVTLSHEAIKPYPMQRWESKVDEDTYAAIAAQAMYGETFELTEDYSSDIVQVIHKARELESRFSFALFAADMSTWVAKASGLKYTDTNVKPGEKYLYRVYSAVPEMIEQIDTGFMYLGVDDYEELPKPLYLKGNFADKMVMLSWNKSYLDDIYIAYMVERSDDGGTTYKTIEELPIVSTIPGDRKPSEKMFKLDSLPQNYKQYFYRIKGYNAFGEIGPPSDPISGMGIEDLGTFPVIRTGDVTDEQSVILTWEFLDKVKVKGFHVMRTGNPGKPYETITKELLSGSERTFTDSVPYVSNYYKVQVIGEYDQIAESYPFMVQLPDSIPPAMPTGLTGEVDTTGIVTLNWKPNKEPDILGYRIYRSNFKDEDYVQKTNKAIQGTTFIDTIAIKILTKKIYYKIVAVDFRENPSDFSEALELNRPDIIPPVQPLFTKVRSENNGIYMEWINSSSIDVTKHLLYRKKQGDQSWTLISFFYEEDSVLSYMDEQLEKGKMYEYTLVAVDNGKLESKPAKPVLMAYIDSGIKPEIEKVYIKKEKSDKQIVLNWEYDYPGVGRFVIYKATGEGQLITYKAVDGSKTKFIDTEVKINTTYTYRIKVEYKDGKQSPLSKKLIMNY